MENNQTKYLKQSFKGLEQKIRIARKNANSQAEHWFVSQAIKLLNVAWKEFEVAQATENEQEFDGLVLEIKRDIKNAKILLA